MHTIYKYIKQCIIKVTDHREVSDNSLATVFISRTSSEGEKWHKFWQLVSAINFCYINRYKCIHKKLGRHHHHTQSL